MGFQVNLILVFVPFLSFHRGFDEVSVEGDVDIEVVAVDGVLPLPLVEADPHLVVQLQLQHQALALHNGAVAGLGVHDGPLRVVLHDVEVRLLEVPRVDVEVEEVDPRNPAQELALEHVEVVVQVDEDGVEDERLVDVVAVEGLTASHREGRVMDFAGVSWKTSLTLTAFGPLGALGAWRAFLSSFTWSPSLSTVSLVTWKKTWNQVQEACKY